MSQPPRRILEPSFPDDDGVADPGVRAALAGASYTGALAALQTARLLVPVVAVLGEVEYDESGLAHDKTSDMAAVLLTGRDGRLALLAFTGLDSLAQWNPDARPVPVSARLAARSALQQEAAALLVDVAGPHQVVVEGEDLEALAVGWTLAEDGGRPAWIRPGGE